MAVVYLVTGRAQLAQNEIKAAEQTGYKVDPALKKDIAKRVKSGG